jgi:hypothetical protein
MSNSCFLAILSKLNFFRQFLINFGNLKSKQILNPNHLPSQRFFSCVASGELSSPLYEKDVFSHNPSYFTLIVCLAIYVLSSFEIIIKYNIHPDVLLPIFLIARIELSYKVFAKPNWTLKTYHDISGKNTLPFGLTDWSTFNLFQISLFIFPNGNDANFINCIFECWFDNRDFRCLPSHSLMLLINRQSMFRC